MKIKKIEHGVYSAPDWYNGIMIPLDAYNRISKIFPGGCDPARREALTAFIGISMKHKKWCSVRRHILYEELGRGEPKSKKVIIEMAVEGLIKNGLLEVFRLSWRHGHKKVIGPTKKLFEKFST